MLLEQSDMYTQNIHLLNDHEPVIGGKLWTYSL